jgi:hypothetical protein
MYPTTRRTLFTGAFAAACSLLSLGLAPLADAATLYAASAAGGPGNLYLLNPDTGAVIQTIGPTNDAAGANYPITGLAVHPTSGVLYGSTGNSSVATAARLVTINPLTAEVTLVGSYNAGPVNGSGTPATMADIEFDSAGNLYGVGSIGGPQLYSINVATAQATVIGNTGLTSTTGGGLGISPNGVFFGTPTASRFGTYDSGTGAYTNITNPTKPTGGGAYGALSFRGSVLYGLNVGAGSPPPTALAIIDPPTGALTSVGSSLASLDAIAFVPVPEPATIGLGLMAAVAIAIMRRR